MRVNFDTDELYPVIFIEEAEEGDSLVREISDDVLDRFQRAMKDFWAMQKELRELMIDGRPSE